MFEFLIFALTHYALLLVFVVGFWGLGSLTVRLFKFDLAIDSVTRHVLAIVLGQGLYIVYLQILGVTGMLNATSVYAGIGICVVAMLTQLKTRVPQFVQKSLTFKEWSRSEQYVFLLMLLYLLPTVLAPLRLPLPGDETMYHLPHAEQWVMHGKITINEWLRYPRFPYNIDLLFAAGLAAYDDVFSHFFNSLVGWLIAILIYRFGSLNFNKIVACLAVIFWVHINRGDWGKGWIDMGVALYTFSASMMLYAWWTDTKKIGALVLACFLLGVAVGSKYQALFFVPIFAMFVLWRLRTAKDYLYATAAFLIPCAYWYIRNYWQVGDPFSPIGGKFFGFTDWNLSDYSYQFFDLKNASDWPHVIFWPALCALGLLRMRPTSPQSFALWVSFVFGIFWLWTSRYPRYLLPVMPFIALFAAHYWLLAINRIWQYLRSKTVGKFLAPFLPQTLALVLALMMLASSVAVSMGHFNLIASSAAAREAYLQLTVVGYDVLSFATKHIAGKIYLPPSLGDLKYFAPKPSYGDHFGPWRYSDFITTDAHAYHAKLLSAQFDFVIVELNMHEKWRTNSEFDQLFAVRYTGKNHVLYQVLVPN